MNFSCLKFNNTKMDVSYMHELGKEQSEVYHMFISRNNCS